MARLSNGTTTYGLNVSDRQENGAYLLQVDAELSDATTLVFPAVGAALILLFGGLLLTTVVRCRIAESKNGSFERTDKGLSRAITFYDAPYELCTRATSVLQQENNDIVDAVMKQYGALTHYEPTTDHNANFRQYCSHSFSRTEMVDKGLSPIYEDQKDCDSAVSASPSFQSDDSLEQFCLHQDRTEGQNARKDGEIKTKQNKTKLFSTCSEETVLDGGRKNCSRSQRASSSSCVKKCVLSVHRATNRTDYDPVSLRPDSQNASDSCFRSISALSDDALDSKAKVPPLEDPASCITTANALTRDNVQRCIQGPARKLPLEQWLTEVQTFFPFHGNLPGMENCQSNSTKSRHSETGREAVRLSEGGPERMRMTNRRWLHTRRVRRTRFNQDDFGELKRLLAPNPTGQSSESDLTAGLDEYSGSCLHRMYQPNSLCTDSRHGVNTTLIVGQKAEPPNIVESERPIQVAPGVQCENRSCCSKQCYDSNESHHKLAKSRLQEARHNFDEKQLRGASYFGGTQILAQPESNECHIRGASSLGVEGTSNDGKCTAEKRSVVKEQLRGASSFGGTQVHAQFESHGCDIRRASNLCDQEQINVTDNSDAELRGASVFGGSQIISKVINRKPSRTALLGFVRSEAFQSEINALEKRNASALCCLEKRGECTSSISLTIAHDSDGENSQCETDSLNSRCSYKNNSTVSIKSDNTVIATTAAKPSSVGIEERKQLCTPGASGRCIHKNVVSFDQEFCQVTDCITWCGRYTNCVEAAAADQDITDAPEKSGETCVETSTPVESNEAARSTTKLSIESILNVGKDISVMSAVLRALQKQRDINKDRRKA